MAPVIPLKLSFTALPLAMLKKAVRLKTIHRKKTQLQIAQALDLYQREQASDVDLRNSLACASCLYCHLVGAVQLMNQSQPTLRNQR